MTGSSLTFARPSVFDINPRKLDELREKDFEPSVMIDVSSPFFFVAIGRADPCFHFTAQQSESVPSRMRCLELLLTPPPSTAGAYVSVFRAQWSTCPTLPLHIHVANMTRTLDVYSPYPAPSGDHLVQLSDEVITAVPAVTASHPTREGRYAGGNASGKISFYAPPQV